jgi:hypothetical protein
LGGLRELLSRPYPSQLFRPSPDLRGREIAGAGIGIPGHEQHVDLAVHYYLSTGLHLCLVCNSGAHVERRSAARRDPQWAVGPLRAQASPLFLGATVTMDDLATALQVNNGGFLVEANATLGADPRKLCSEGLPLAPGRRDDAQTLILEDSVPIRRVRVHGSSV